MYTTESTHAGYDPDRLHAVRTREDAMFRSRIPRSLELAARARRSMPNGFNPSFGLTSIPTEQPGHGVQHDGGFNPTFGLTSIPTPWLYCSTVRGRKLVFARG